MLTITDGRTLSRALNSPLNDLIKRLLTRRCRQLGGDISGEARFVVASPGDTLQTIETALGFSVLENAGDGTRFGRDREFTPGWEWLQNHRTCFELLFLFDDGGFAHVLVVEKAPGIAPELWRLCSMYSSENA